MERPDPAQVERALEKASPEHNWHFETVFREEFFVLAADLVAVRDERDYANGIASANAEAAAELRRQNVSLRAELAEEREEHSATRASADGWRESYEIALSEVGRERAAREAAERRADVLAAQITRSDEENLARAEAAEADNRRLRGATSAAIDACEEALTGPQLSHIASRNFDRAIAAIVTARAALAGLGETTAPQSGAAAATEEQK